MYLFICTVAFYSTVPDTNQLHLRVLLAVATSSSSSCSSSFIMPAVTSNNLEGSTRSADGCQWGREGVLQMLLGIKVKSLPPAVTGGCLSLWWDSPDATSSLPGSWGGRLHHPSHHWPPRLNASLAGQTSPGKFSLPSRSHRSAYKGQI